MRRARIAAFALAACLALPACSTTAFKWHYRTPIEQGNLIDGEQIKQLELGMSAEQVRFLLGTPLARDPLRPGRWDYLYWFCSGDSQLSRVRMSLRFDQGRLARTEPAIDEMVVNLTPRPATCR